MHTKYILVATSLFCSKKNWPVLLKAIQRFNRTIYLKPFFCLELNYLSGENIRFSYLAKEVDAEQLVKHAEEYFLGFFNSIKPEIIQQTEGIFKNFEQNKVYYGLYNPIIIKKGERKYYRLQFMLSKLLIAALKDEHNLDSETILTLAYYFNITVIKTAVENFSVDGKQLIAIYRDRYYTSRGIGNKEMQSKFQENEHILLEITNSLGKKDSPRWLRKWKTFLVDFMNDESMETTFKTISIFEQIKIQLALNSKMEVMLCYFIFRVLRERFRHKIAESQNF